jgi:hypothetical protein
MYLVRLSMLSFAFWLASFSALADEGGTLRFLRTDSFNGSNRQPAVWIDDGYPIDLRLNSPLEVPVGSGQHTITIATRVPADPKQFMKRHQETVYVRAGSVVDLEVTWAANLFAGEHHMKVTNISTPQLNRPTTQAEAPHPQVQPALPAAMAPAQNVAAGFTGRSTRTWPDGARYEGDFVGGRMHGNGVLQFADGNVSQGTFDNDSMTGKGTFLWANGDRYDGGFVKGAIQGMGVLKAADGSTYKGDFVNGRKTGTGEMVWPNGDRYAGRFVDGVRTGLGVYEWPNGDRYEGDFFNNQRTGKGRYTTRDGRRYEGDFVSGRQVTPSKPPGASGAESAATLLGLFGSFMEGYTGERRSAPIDFDSPSLRSPVPGPIKLLAPVPVFAAPSVERQYEATGLDPTKRYSGTVDRFGNARLSPQFDPGTVYKGSLNDDGSGKLRAYDGSEITVRPR